LLPSPPEISQLLTFFFLKQQQQQKKRFQKENRFLQMDDLLSQVSINAKKRKRELT
jgi:hypothetical protein